MTELIRPPRKLHLLSKVVLRRFCDGRGLMSTLNPQRPSERMKLKAPGAVCFTKDLKPKDPFAFEELWKSVEDVVGEALQAVDDGTIFSDERLTGLLRQCLALHFARSLTILRMASDLAPIMMKNAEERMLHDPRLVSLGGLIPAGPEGREIMARSSRERIESQWFRPDLLIPERFMANFQVALRRVEGHPFEIAVAEDGEFLIGDAPAQTFDPAKGVGPLGGVPWDQAKTVLMPLGRRHAMGLAPVSKYVTFDRPGIEFLNGIQIARAEQRVMWHPDAALEEFVQVRLSERSLPEDPDADSHPG